MSEAALFSRLARAAGLPLALGLLLAACGGAPSTAVTPAPAVSAPTTPNPATPAPVTPAPITPAPVTPTTTRPSLVLQNLDDFPVPNRLVFNRIHDNAGQFVVHDRAALRISNTGTAPLRLDAAALDPNWAFDAPVIFPQTVAPGGSLTLSLRFVADQDPALPPRLYTGQLVLTTSDPAAPRLSAQLAGIWQGGSERYSGSNLYDEPSLELIRQAFGLNIRLNTAADAAPPTGRNTDGSSVPYNQRGAVRPQGDEVLSAYWVVADASQPVSVREVAAWSGQNDTATLSWYAKGDSALNPLVRRATGSGQTLFPVGPGSTVGGAVTTFTPGGVFGLNMNGYEWSDAGLNRQTADQQHGCVNLCGQHLRFWPVTDAAGQTVPNAYLMAVDYLGINDDYQDDLFLLRNIKPAPVLLKVGATDATYRGPDGRVWLPDRRSNGNVYFTPAAAVDEPAQPYTGPVGNTSDANLYRTYRGNVGNVPQNQRVMTFEVPIDNGSYSVRLHFIDQAHSAAGQRVFDVTVNGLLRLPNLDIVAAAGGGQRALVRQLDDVQVTGGVLRVTLSASVDYPALSAIEIVR